jgi:hypothetical protein
MAKPLEWMRVTKFAWQSITAHWNFADLSWHFQSEKMIFLIEWKIMKIDIFRTNLCFQISFLYPVNWDYNPPNKIKISEFIFYLA